MTSVPPQRDPQGQYDHQQPPQGDYPGHPPNPGPGNAEAPVHASGPLSAPSAAPSAAKSPPGKGTLLAFIALLVIGGTWAFSAIGQTIILEIQASPAVEYGLTLSAIIFPVNRLFAGTAYSVGLLVLTFIAFPYRMGHFIGLGIALLHFLGLFLLMLLGISLNSSSMSVMIALLPIPRSVLVLVAAVIVACLPAAYRARGMRNPVRVVAISLAALPLALGATIITIVDFSLAIPGPLNPEFVISQIPVLLQSIALAILVVLAALPWAWSRFTAAGLALIVLVIDIVGIVGPTALSPSDATRPLIIVEAVVPGLAAALLVVAGVLTLRERRAGPIPPTQQPPPAPRG